MISCKDVREPASGSLPEAGTRTYKLRSRFNGRRRWPLHVRCRRKSSRSLSHLLMSSCFYNCRHNSPSSVIIVRSKFSRTAGNKKRKFPIHADCSIAYRLSRSSSRNFITWLMYKASKWSVNCDVSAETISCLAVRLSQLDSLHRPNKTPSWRTIVNCLVPLTSVLDFVKFHWNILMLKVAVTSSF